MNDDYITAMFKHGLEKIVYRKNFPRKFTMKDMLNNQTDKMTGSVDTTQYSSLITPTLV